jgi:hypothetical protein
MSVNFTLPPGACEAQIPLTRAQRKIVLPAAGWIMKRYTNQHWTDSIFLCCFLVIVPMLDSSWPCIVVQTEGETRPLRYCPYPSQHEFINATLGHAMDLLGIEDLGAAFTHVAATFIVTDPRIAASRNRKMRALRTKLLQLQSKAMAEQGGGTP